MTEPPEPAGAGTVTEPLFMVNPGDPRKWVIAARALRDRIASGKPSASAGPDGLSSSPSVL